MKFWILCLLPLVLLQCGQSGDYTQKLYHHIKAGDLAAVKKDIARGANYQGDPAQKEETPLHLAVTLGHLDIVRYLVDTMKVPADGQFYDPNSDFGPSTPLYFAAQHNHPEVVRYLLEKGADPDAQVLGYTALHIAAQKNFDGVVRVLISHGAYPNVQSKDGDVPLLAAIENNNLKMARFLIENGTDPDMDVYISPESGPVKLADQAIKEARKEHRSSFLKLLRDFKRYPPHIKVESRTVFVSRLGKRKKIGEMAASDAFPFGFDPTGAFSPDSALFAYIGTSPKGYDLYLASKYIAKPRPITSTGQIDGRTKIRWSGDGDYLVFNMGERIWLFDAYGHKIRPLTEPPEGYEDADPEFVGDKIHLFRGTRLEYSVSGEEYEINKDGTDLRKVPGGRTIGGEDLR